MEIHLATLLMLYLHCISTLAFLHDLSKPLGLCEGEKLPSLLLFHNAVYTNTFIQILCVMISDGIS